MNKFGAFIVLTLAACALAAPSPFAEQPGDVETESEFAIYPEDSEEVADLKDEHKVFTDFCKTSRDSVISKLRSQTNGATGKLFTVFFGTFTDIGEEALSIQKMATDRLGNQIINPEAEIDDATNEYEESVAEQQRRIQEESVQPNTVLQAITTNLRTVKDVVSKRIYETLRVLSAYATPKVAVEYLEQGCDEIENYENKLLDDFASFKKAVVENNPNLEKVKLEDVGCTTARRVVRLRGACQLVQSVRGPAVKLMATARA